MSVYKMAVAHCVRLIQCVIQYLVQFQDGRHIPESTLEFFSLSVELAYRELLVLDLTDQLTNSQKEAIEIVRQCLVVGRELERLSHSSESHAPSTVSTIYSGAVGRPRHDISEQSLELLLENRFTVPQISRMFGVSISTVRRRMSALGLFVRAYYSTISDTDLDAIICEVQQQYPMCGNRQMQGHLLSRGYRIQQARLRDSQRRIDPSGTALHRPCVLNRRQYYVPGPLSLYHIDGHHKLIRWMHMYITESNFINFIL